MGLSTTGNISLGWALVAGRNLVPRPAAGNTALRTFIFMGRSFFVARFSRLVARWSFGVCRWLPADADHCKWSRVRPFNRLLRRVVVCARTDFRCGFLAGQLLQN